MRPRRSSKLLLLGLLRPSSRLTSWYFKGFELLWRYHVKHSTGVDLQNLDLKEVDQEMAIDEAAQSSASEGDAPEKAPADDAPTDDAPTGDNVVVGD